MKPSLTASGLALAVLLAGACGDGGAPVARLTVAPGTASLPYPGSDRLTARWELLEPLDPGARPQVFVHLIEEPGIVLRTYDHPFPGPWEPGSSLEATIELWQSALSPPLAPGSYSLTVGLYDSGSDRRWALDVPGEEVERREYAVARVEVPAPTAAGPEVSFSEDWLVPESTGDRQVFSVRPLGGTEGWIALDGLEGPVYVTVTLALPRLEEHGFRLLLDEGASQPRVMVDTDCGAEMASVEGQGRHEVTIALQPAEPGGSCSLHFDPNYVYLHEASFTRRTLTLERLVWGEADAAPPG